MNPSDKAALVTSGKRWAMITLGAYAILSIGMWVARVGFSAPLGQQSDLDMQTFVIASITIGGLYSAVLALRQPRAHGAGFQTTRP
jgi:hypothetical protein